MWVIVHALSGLALAVLLPVGLGYLLVCAFILHALLDIVPHWDYTQTRRRLVWASIDVSLAALIIAALALALDLSAVAVAVAFASAAPDLDVLDGLLPGKPRRRWFPSHWKAFPHGQTRARLGVPIQLAVIVASAVMVALGA